MKKSQSNVIYGPWSTAISCDVSAGQMHDGPSVSGFYADKNNGTEVTPKEKEEGKKDEEKQIKEDLTKLTRTELKARYKREYSSWSNMKNRCNHGNGVLHPEFADFVRFLSHMGPKPADSYSLDRIDYKNPEYGPGNCRWASKTTQTRNRSNTVLLEGAGGVVRPLTEWASLLGISEKTLYNRRSKGWPDLEILYGRHSKPSGKTVLPRESASAEWRRIVPGFPPERLEARYQKTRHRVSIVAGNPEYESRHRWLIRYASEMKELAKERVLASMVAPDDNPDPHLQALYEHYLELWQAASRALSSN